MNTLTTTTPNARVKITGRLDQKNNFTIINKGTRESPTSALKLATNIQNKIELVFVKNREI